MLGVCLFVGCMYSSWAHLYWSDACIQVVCISWIGSDWMHWIVACNRVWGQWVCFAACLRPHAWACILSMFGACMPVHMHPPSHLCYYCTCACIDVCYCVALMLHRHWHSCLCLLVHRRPHRLLSYAALARCICICHHIFADVVLAFTLEFALALKLCLHLSCIIAGRLYTNCLSSPNLSLTRCLCLLYCS